jgi:hypothetical protein
MLTKLTVLAAILCLSSCGRHRTSYAIRDFPDTLQPWLTRAVNTGIVGYDTAATYIRAHATDGEIIQLSQAENPILRAIALYEMTHRPGLNHLDILLAHLDDTAIIMKDYGEWGLQQRSVTDNMILQAGWKTEAARDTVANEIILHYDHLGSAYTALRRFGPKPQYYSHIREMALRDGLLDEELLDALFGLAKYKKKEDIPLIKGIISERGSVFISLTFGFLSDYPDTAYLELLESYYPRNFYRTIRRDRTTDHAMSYIKALAVYKADTCARIITSILNRKPILPGDFSPATQSDFWEQVVHVIWANPCPAFAALRTRITPELHRILRRDSLWNLQPDTSFHPITLLPTPAEPVSW